MNSISNSPAAAGSESGSSLISLMIGIALSSITILTATHMQTSHRLAVNDLNLSITHDRTILTSLSVIEKAIQSAGFGITAADQNHISVEFDAGSTTIPARRSLLWRFMTDENGDDAIPDTPRCRALIESGGEIDGRQYRFLKLFRSNTCQINTPIQDITWDEEVGRLGSWEIKGELAAHINSNQSLFNFQLNPTECSFPGLGDPQPHLSITVEAPNSAKLNGHDLPSNGITVCLTNMNP